jgi:energy-coupling factor transporter ATP-binding protein EcfA2
MDSFLNWLQSLPLWSKKILTEFPDLSNESILKASEYCIQEAKKTLPDNPFSYSIKTQSAEKSLQLVSIDYVEGIGRLATKTPLIFNDKTTIIYGLNGTGKTSYTNILHHLCAPYNKTLLPNVYIRENPAMQYGITYKVDDIQKIYKFPNNCENENIFRNIDIFDDGSNDRFIGSECEYSIEPCQLQFLQILANYYDNVKNQLQNNLQKRESPLPILPSQYEKTRLGAFYRKAVSSITNEEIELKITWDSKDFSKLNELHRRLLLKDPKIEAQQIERLIKDKEKLLEKLQSLNKLFSIDSLKFASNLKKFSAKKKQEAEEAATLAFSDCNLDGIGLDTWKSMWKSAKNFSEFYAYKDIEFPNIKEGAVCVLCHQPLTDEAKERMSKFESFVISSLEKEGKDVEDQFRNLPIIKEPLITIEEIEMQMKSVGYEISKFPQVVEYLQQILFIRETLLSERTFDETEIILKTFSTEQVSISSDIEFDQVKLNQLYNDANEENRPLLIIEKVELEAKKWVYEQKEALQRQVEFLNENKVFNEALSLTNTKKLTVKADKLSQELLTEPYVNSFNLKLKELGASNLQVELVKAKSKKGKGSFRIQLINADTKIKPSEILSNGEKRIISLAAFLADSTLSGHCSPFIFDDPISSLDQEFEDHVVDCLINLSEMRQVIIFSHRLTFVMNLLEKSKNSKTIELKQIPEIGVGIPSEPEITLNQDAKKGSTALIEDIKRYQKQISNDQNALENYSSKVQSFCCTLRKLIEKSIEDELLSKIVTRFSRVIHSSCINKLKKITARDCDLLDELMTKYSFTEHSQPCESPLTVFTLETILADCKILNEWIIDFRKLNCETNNKVS